MPIPKTGAELVEIVTTSFDKLRAELDADIARPCAKPGRLLARRKRSK